MFIFGICSAESLSIAILSGGNMEYDVFISYSRKDYVDANGISYWFDEDGVFEGNLYAHEIVYNIKTSKLFLCISSELFASSRYLNRLLTIANCPSDTENCCGESYDIPRSNN